MSGKTERIDHCRYMDDSATDAEYTGEEACSDGSPHTEWAVVREGRRVEGGCRDDFLAAIKEKQCRCDHEATEYDAKRIACEKVRDVAAEQGTGDGADCEADRCIIIDLVLPDIGNHT